MSTCAATDVSPPPVLSLFAFLEIPVPNFLSLFPLPKTSAALWFFRFVALAMFICLICAQFFPLAVFVLPHDFDDAPVAPDPP